MKVYLKTDDMLFSGGNGTGLSFYIKYAEVSTDDNPVVIAKGCLLYTSFLQRYSRFRLCSIRHRCFYRRRNRQQCHGPVSYTHLDVYKRQVRTWCI